MNNNHRSNSLSNKLHDRLYQQIVNTKPGEKLPSEPKLAKMLGVSRATLREAMRTFETQGIIHRRQGVGTFVLHPARTIDAGLEKLESIHTIGERSNLDVKMSYFHVTRREAKPKEKEHFAMDSGKQVLQITWVIEAENRPVAYLVDILPEDILSMESLRQQFDGSILDLLLRNSEITLTTSRTEISAVAAEPDVAKALGVQRGSVLLYFEANLYTASGRQIDHSYSYYLPGYFRFHVVRRVGQEVFERPIQKNS